MTRRLLAVAALLGVATCGGDESHIEPPPAGEPVDYQLGGAYPPPTGVGIVVRDRLARPVEGLYSICYVNAFQTQPGELDRWPADLLLIDDAGDPVVDTGWPDEVLLDTSTPARRQRIAEIVGAWIDDCGEDGFDAVELDNLDHFTRSDGALTAADDLALAELLIGRAHDAGLAVGQKNGAELSEQGVSSGFDFAVTESCERFDECDDYVAAYGSAVIEIEYLEDGDEPFERACTARGDEISIVQRDRDLVPAGEVGYHFATCP